MNQAARHALQVETEFLAGLDSNLPQARGRLLRGSIWSQFDQDQTDELRALMQERRLFDRDLLGQLPRNRRKVLCGYRRTWWLGKRRTSVTVASVCGRLGEYLSDASAEPAPVDLPELVSHVRSLLVDDVTPHVIGVCSPSGFTPEARSSQLDLPNVTLVLVEPRRDGGWTVTPVNDDTKKDLCRLFDPEDVARKIRRVRAEIDARSADLLTSGLSAATIQEATGLEPGIVAAGFEAAAVADPELRMSRQGDELLLFRGAPVPASETSTMSISDFIRQLFGLEGAEAKKINHLSEQRASLAQRRDRVYEDITKLENKEADLLEQGRTNKSETVRRRVASQISQIRKDIGRLNATANVLGQQINILSTHIHNLTLIQQDRLAEMPETEEITADAVRAEEMLESLKADADLVGSLDSGVADLLASEDEKAILAEFDQPAAAPDRTSEPTGAASRQVHEPRTPEPQKPEPEAS